jgi:hypothetical protein
MTDDNQDIFGKIDALLEKRAGFGAGALQRHAEDDFPLLTEVVEVLPGSPARPDRRQGERRLGVERRQGERRKGALAGPEAPRATLSEEQFDRFLARFEQKLEDLFIRQQLRLEEAMRRALQGQGDKARGGSPDPL